jgi:hypothetical protein
MKVWNLSAYEEKQVLQEILFPKKLYYHKETNKYLTYETNAVLSEIQTLKKTRRDKIKKDLPDFSDKSLVVASELSRFNLFVKDFRRLISLGS